VSVGSRRDLAVQLLRLQPTMAASMLYDSTSFPTTYPPFFDRDVPVTEGPRSEILPQEMPSFSADSLYDYGSNAYAPPTKQNPQLLPQQKPLQQVEASMYERRSKKQKQCQIVIQDTENFLLRYSKNLQERAASDGRRLLAEQIQLPQRKLLTGPSLAEDVRIRCKSLLPQLSQDELDIDYPIILNRRAKQEFAHPALTALYLTIPDYLSPFDKGKQESLSWTQRYAPKKAKDVLQDGREAIMLRDWMKSQIVNSVDKGVKKDGTKRRKVVVPKKKKKRPKGLDGFIVSSDEEAEEMTNVDSEEASDDEFFNRAKKSQVRSGDSKSDIVSNSVLLSGPPGSGKTAAIYAAAKELGFEVFEINSGERRGKKEIMDRIGGMMNIHLVDMASRPLVPLTNGSTESSKQKTLNAMFGGAPKKIDLDKRPKLEEKVEESEEPPAKKTKPNPEDEKIDKQEKLNRFFMPMSQKKSKPVVETAEPKPPTQLLTVLPDRSSPKKERREEPFPMQQEEPVQSPMEVLSPSKKASQQMLNFGQAKKSEKGSVPKAQKQSLILLEEVDVLFEEDTSFWATVIELIKSSKRPVVMTCNDESLIPLDDLQLHAILRFQSPSEDILADYLLIVAALEGHVISRDSVLTLLRHHNHDLRRSLMSLDFWCQTGIGDQTGGLNWILQRWPKGADVDSDGHIQRVISEDSIYTGIDVLGAAHSFCGSTEDILIEAWEQANVDLDNVLGSRFESDFAQDWSVSSASRLSTLRYIESHSEDLSTGDIAGGVLGQDYQKVRLDPTTPYRANSMDKYGYKAFECAALDVTDRLRLSIEASTRALSSSSHRTSLVTRRTSPSRLQMAQAIVDNKVEQNNQTVAQIYKCFLPLQQSLSDFSEQSALYRSVVHDPVFLVSTDTSPYIRTIVRADVALSEIRLQQSSLLSAGGRPAKKQRMTRASRSAMGWQSRASTRRDRWFTDRMNYQIVLKTAGAGWPVESFEDVTGSQTNTQSSDASNDEDD
jgi:DNA polymerase III delta prime subunit